MAQQSGFFFDDSDSRTRSEGLEVVYAYAEKIERFDMRLFGGFSSTRALTYTSSIPMILGLLQEFDYEDFECVFGHGGIVKQDAEHLLSFQGVLDAGVNKGFVGIKNLSDDRRQNLYDRVAKGAARFFVVKDAMAHA